MRWVKEVWGRKAVSMDLAGCRGNDAALLASKLARTASSKQAKPCEAVKTWGNHGELG